MNNVKQTPAGMIDQWAYLQGFLQSKLNPVASKPAIVENKINVFNERWTDPGSYPSGAGGSALPSFTYGVAEGNYTVKFTDEQMSAVAHGLGLTEDFTLMTADQVFDLSLNYAKRMVPNGTELELKKFRLGLWHEIITEEITVYDLGWPEIVINKSEVEQYLGAGRFFVEILEADVD
jgi:hypothetical protein